MDREVKRTALAYGHQVAQGMLQVAAFLRSENDAVGEVDLDDPEMVGRFLARQMAVREIEEAAARAANPGGIADEQEVEA